MIEMPWWVFGLIIVAVLVVGGVIAIGLMYRLVSEKDTNKGYVIWEKGYPQCPQCGGVVLHGAAYCHHCNAYLIWKNNNYE